MRKLSLSPEISKILTHGRVEKSLFYQPFYLRRFKSKSISQNSKPLLLATCLVNTWQLLFEKMSLMKRDCQKKNWWENKVWWNTSKRNSSIWKSTVNQPGFSFNMQIGDQQLSAKLTSLKSIFLEVIFEITELRYLSIWLFFKYLENKGK